jgi:hypothetical protein
MSDDDLADAVRRIDSLPAADRFSVPGGLFDRIMHGAIMHAAAGVRMPDVVEEVDDDV